MNDVAETLSGLIAATLLNRRYPTEIRLGRAHVKKLINESCSLRLTVRGQDAPIFEAYCRDHPEVVPLYAIQGYAERKPAVTRRALVHMRCLKRAFGISHFDGVPIHMTEDGRIDVVSKGWDER